MNNSPRTRRVNSSFQWYKIVVDGEGRKSRVLRQGDDLPRLGNAHEAIRRDYGNKAHREWYVKKQKAYRKRVLAKVPK